MDSSFQSQSPDNYDVKPSFRKPSNDAANRKYRRHSPASGSASSSPGGSPNSFHSHNTKEDSRKMSEYGQRKKDDGRDMDMDTRGRSGKDNELYKHSERHYGNSRDYRKHLNDDYKIQRRHADEDERSNQRLSSRSGQQSRGSTCSDHTRPERNYDRSRENWQNLDKYSRDRRDDRGHRSKYKERDTEILDRDKESGSRQINSSMDEMTVGWDRHQDRGGRDDKRGQRRGLGDDKNDHASCYEELRGQAKDSTTGRDKGSCRLKERDRSSNRVMNEQKEDLIHKRKHVDKEHNKHKEQYTRELEEHFQSDTRSSSSHRDRGEKHEQYWDKTIHVNEDCD